MNTLVLLGVLSVQVLGSWCFAMEHVTVQTSKSNPQPPHVVLMIIDELGTGDVPWADHLIHAPTLLKLGENSLRLGTQYAWQWCAPTRGALLSGRFPMHSGYNGGGMPGDGQGMDLNMPLLPGDLKRAGYATHMLGKWHLGFRTADNLPVHRGFDSYFGLLGGGADHYNKVEEAGSTTCANFSSNQLPFRVDFFDGDKPAAPHKVHSPLQCPEEFLRPYPLDSGGVCQSTPETCGNRGYGPACGCGYMCYCNRRIIRGMVSVVDSMVSNLTSALQRKGMWDSTVFVFLGDNGAPNNNAGSNSIFKGMKFGHYEGGHRVAAFIGGGLLSNKLRGQWYNQTLHLVDLHATICDLAGVVPASPSTMTKVDGVSVVGVLNGSMSLGAPVRTELWIADTVLRMGEYKLITGPQGAGAPQCMLGLGGLPVPTPTDPNNLTTVSGSSHCTGHETGVDADLCQKCVCASWNTTDQGAADPKCRPCLFNVEADPGEQVNLASSMPELVASMTTRISELSKTEFNPAMPKSDLYTACKAMVEAGGFFVPWASN
eukprot:m.953623 g.953623  ORF g.953623 m.953623 type:complete len:543 (-) comp23871_c1_seq11:3532-5160(-)